MGIITRLYNQRFNIYRIQTDTVSASFEVNPQSRVLVSSNVTGRLTNAAVNEPTREGSVKDMGEGYGFKQKLFVPTGTDIKEGDFVVQRGNTTNSFFVDFINKYPGGHATHHYECLLTTSTYMGS